MTHDQLIDTTAWLWGIPRPLLLSRSRAARVVEARQALSWALRQGGWSLEEIGDLLDRHHTTIMDQVEIAERRAKQNARYQERLHVLAAPPIDWRARCMELEQKVTELEARLSLDQARRRAA